MYADILIEHPYARKKLSFTYEVPASMSIKEGSGVLVPFMKGQKAGLVLRVHHERPDFAVKEILNLLEDESLLADWQLQLAKWISEYYLCSKYDALRLMLPKNIFRVPKRKRERKEEKTKANSDDVLTLTPEQDAIVKTILQEKTPVSLIHGITGSGKTEIYRHLINKVVQDGKQALLLVPEIALTPQFKKYFERSFPNMAVIHSQVAEGKRADLWRDIRDGKIQLVLGSRSSLFAPFKNLGLVILDEEQEWSYKQDQTPRYHAREVALKLRELLNIQMVMGSATPSIETMWKASQNEYKLFTISERIHSTPLPTVKLIDMREELRAGRYSIFSDELEQQISLKLAVKEQTILFLNRRGSASCTICRDCGLSSKCPNCETSLTYHATNFRNKTLICHHCGFLAPVPTLCPACKSTRIKHMGLGTERVETELQKLFPLAKIARADKDTMSAKGSFGKLNQRLHAGEIDILIGTQMIGKGWDLPNVTLVGVIMADIGLHIPDFRTPERLFQLLTQVAGRAGRRKKQGEVLIQTYNPEHPSLHFSQTHDFLGFFEQEISSRRKAQLPPFGTLIKIIVVEDSENKAQNRAQDLAKELKTFATDQDQIFAAPALFTRINNRYQWNILIQSPDARSLLNRLPLASLAEVRIDVDPLISI